nr:hypothetical protein [uncultured Flavobacterium sp.]
MNNLEIEIKELILKSKDYLAKGKYKLQFKIIAVSLSVFAIYTVGKSLGEIIYFIKN